jgi:hypothetical protein
VVHEKSGDRALNGARHDLIKSLKMAEQLSRTAAPTIGAIKNEYAGHSHDYERTLTNTNLGVTQQQHFVVEGTGGQTLQGFNAAVYPNSDNLNAVTVTRQGSITIPISSASPLSFFSTSFKTIELAALALFQTLRGAAVSPRTNPATFAASGESKTLAS